MYMNFWYAAAASEDVGATPYKVQMLGQWFVLFRDSQGVAHCLPNTCTHRGGSLGDGKVRGDTIECPYHGWRFNGAGACTRIPSIGADAKVPPRANTDSYPTIERYGLIFAFLGDLPEAERPPLMAIPEWDSPDWRVNVMANSYRANYERAVENTLDPAHNEFVHPTHGFEGERDDYKVADYAVDEVPYGCGFMTKFQSPALKDGTMSKFRDFAGDLEAGAGHVGPSATWTLIHMTPTNWFHQYTFTTPITATHSRNWLFSARNALLDPQHDDAIEKRQRAIQEQDRVVLEALAPPVPSMGYESESLMPADRAISRYRRYLKEWTDKGWRIDDEAAAAEAHRRLSVIPSPARREGRLNSIRTVPTVPGRSEGTARAA